MIDLSPRFFFQDKGVSVTVVGVGPLVYKKGDNMRKIAGNEGKVFLYADFSMLSNHFDVIMERACGTSLIQFHGMCTDKCQCICCGLILSLVQCLLSYF